MQAFHSNKRDAFFRQKQHYFHNEVTIFQRHGSGLTAYLNQAAGRIPGGNVRLEGMGMWSFGDFGFSTVKRFNKYFPRLGHHRKAPSSKKSWRKSGFCEAPGKKLACQLFQVSWCKGDLLYTRWKCPTFESLRKQCNFLTGKLWVETCPRNRIDRYRTSVWHSSPLRIHAWRTYNVKWMMCLYWTVSDVKGLVGPFLSTNRSLELFFKQMATNPISKRNDWRIMVVNPVYISLHKNYILYIFP